MHSTKNVVRFDDNPTFHHMITWDHAYREARKGPWETLARDRIRFQLRIQRLETVLTPILTAEHRDKIRKRLNV